MATTPPECQATFQTQLALPLSPSLSAPLYLHLAHMQTVLRVGVARSAQNTISVSD